MKRAAVEENSSSPDNLLTVSGDGTWKTRGHSSLIGVCTVIGAETGKVLDREVLSSFCKGCDSYKGVKFGIKYNKWQRAHKLSCRKNYSGSAGKMEVDGMLRIFNRSEKLHNLKYSNYIGDGDTKTFNALSENKPYGDDHLIQKIECVDHVQKRMGRLTDSLIDKLAHYYGNAIRCNSTSVKEMRKAIWAVWGHSCSTDDEPMHWFCPTNPNTWCKYNAAINNNLQNYKHKPSVAKAVRDVIKPVFADLSHPALLKKCLGGKTQNPNESLNSLIWKFCPKTIGSSLQIAEIAANLATSVFNDGNQILISILEKFGLKINRNVCVSLAERDNRRIFTSRQRRLESSFEARRAKKIKKSKEIELFQEQEDGDRFNSCQVIYSQFGLAIHQNDHQARRRFVEWAQNEIAVVPDFHKRILFSDEAHFWLNGYVNKQNCRIWSEANPQVYVETPLHPEKLTVWCALWAGGIIGPYFFKNDEGHNVTVNGDLYRAMITNFFFPELNNHDVQELWFQQDGATCHTARATIDLLKDTFGDRLISRFGPVNWPPRSCDLTPLDYFCGAM
ncbi:uncharacterized protein TNCV_2183881 [Trichonephila clavipes]|nr:uncharacterized protein TNCV_2183881 [Trichonephila clavipes]